MHNVTPKPDPCGPAKLQISATRSIRLRTEIPGTQARTLFGRLAHVNERYATVMAAKAHGALVYDVDGNVLIDFVSGHLTGHTPDHLIETLRNSAETLIALGRGGTSPAAVALCERLTALIPYAQKTLLFDSIGDALAALPDGMTFSDERDTGFGRTGRLFAFEWEGVKPDMVLLSGFSAGLPLAALTGRANALDGILSEGGTEIACRAALSVIDYVLAENLAGRASQLEAIVRERVLQWQASYPVVRGVDGRGVLLDVRLDSDETARRVAAEALQRGLILRTQHAALIPLRPPLMCPEEQLYEALDVLEDALETVLKVKGT